MFGLVIPLLLASFAVVQKSDWTPIEVLKDPVPGSALDFSSLGLQDGPCGKYGWVVVRNGQFEFEGKPGVRQRFYGGNICASAAFPNSDEDAERLVLRLKRMGHNSLRIHHHDAPAVGASADGVSLDAKAMEKLDRLIAAASRHGLYVTTDLMVSRNPTWRALGVDRDGRVGRAEYKYLILLDDRAYADYTAFASNFLSHVNVKTGRAYRDEPALAFISLINEGSPLMNGRHWNVFRKLEQALPVWRKWLAEKKRADASFAPSIKADAAIPTQVYHGENGAVVQLFYAELEAAFVRKMTAYLRGLGVKALLTNNNCSRHDAPQLKTAGLYDYVDDHYYFNHPYFTGKAWQSPCGVDNTDFVDHPGAGMDKMSFRRLVDKPLTVSEYNYCGPARYRGFGQILAGAMAARQGFGALWRFNYAQRSTDWMTNVGGPDAFCVARDPLALANDRISLLLFLRGDMPELPRERGIALALTPDAVRRPKGCGPLPSYPPWADLAWHLRVGTVQGDGQTDYGRTFSRAEAEKTAFAAALRKSTPKAEDFLHVVSNGVVGVKSARTVALFVRKGKADFGPLTVDVSGEPANVAVASLDGAPLETSRRLLLIHLTDVQGDWAKYESEKRAYIEKWFGKPFARNGRARISLDAAHPDDLEVWALDMAGNRRKRLTTAVAGGKLGFTAEIGGETAYLHYEIVRR